MGFSMNVCDTEEIKNEVIEAVKPEKEEVKKLKVNAKMYYHSK